MARLQRGLFSVLFGFWIANYIAFNGDAIRNLATQFLALAEGQAATAPRMIGHRLMGTSLLLTGAIAQGRAHFDQGIALYDPKEHRQLAKKYGQDVRVAILSDRAKALWMLGYPEAALADVDCAQSDAREIGHAATLMFVLAHTSTTHMLCGNYTAATAQANELVALAEEKGAQFWKVTGMLVRGLVVALTDATAAVQIIASGITAYRSTGSTVSIPWCLPILARPTPNSANSKMHGDALTKQWWRSKQPRRRCSRQRPIVLLAKSH